MDPEKTIEKLSAKERNALDKLLIEAVKEERVIYDSSFKKSVAQKDKATLDQIFRRLRIAMQPSLQAAGLGR